MMLFLVGLLGLSAVVFADTTPSTTPTIPIPTATVFPSFNSPPTEGFCNHPTPTTFSRRSCTINPSAMCCLIYGTWLPCTSGPRFHPTGLGGDWLGKRADCPPDWCPYSSGCWQCSNNGDNSGGTPTIFSAPTKSLTACPGISCSRIG